MRLDCTWRDCLWIFLFALVSVSISGLIVAPTDCVLGDAVQTEKRESLTFGALLDSCFPYVSCGAQL